MVKKILSILCVLLLAGYLVFSAVAMTDRHEDVRMCKGVDLHITDSLDIELIDENMIDEDGFILLGSGAPTPTPPAPDEGESTIDGDTVNVPSMSIDDEGIMDVPYGLEMVLE